MYPTGPKTPLVGLYVPVKHPTFAYLPWYVAEGLVTPRHSTFLHSVDPFIGHRMMKAVIGIDSSAPGGLRPRTPTREQSPLDPNLLRSHSLPARRSGSLPTVAFAPCASLSRSLPAGQSSNSRWTCPLPSAFRRPPSVRDGRRQTGGQRTGVFQTGRRRGGEVAPSLLKSLLPR